MIRIGDTIKSAQTVEKQLILFRRLSKKAESYKKALAVAGASEKRTGTDG